MKKVFQYRYIDGNKWPENITIDGLKHGTIFADRVPIYQLGIQAIPGTKFKLNEGDWVVIGSTGIYELDLQEKAVITSLKFEDKSMEMLENAIAGEGGYLIIDTIYEEEN